jgi:hypothetical protein
VLIFRIEKVAVCILLGVIVCFLLGSFAVWRAL